MFSLCPSVSPRLCGALVALPTTETRRHRGEQSSKPHTDNSFIDNHRLEQCSRLKVLNLDSITDVARSASLAGQGNTQPARVAHDLHHITRFDHDVGNKGVGRNCLTPRNCSSETKSSEFSEVKNVR